MTYDLWHSFSVDTMESTPIDRIDSLYIQLIMKHSDFDKNDWHDTKADDILNNANGDGNLDYLSFMVKVANLSVVANILVENSLVANILLENILVPNILVENSLIANILLENILVPNILVVGNNFWTM